MINHERRVEIKNRVMWLRDTLIPDLIESGTTATAEDFEFCCAAIEELLPRQETLLSRKQAVAILKGSGADTAMELAAFFDITDEEIEAVRQ